MPAAAMDVIAAGDTSPGPLAALLLRLHELIGARGVHPARAVVLVPYAQLMASARTAWAALVPDGFAPRFETTLNLAARSGFHGGVEDLAFERGLDLLAARHWLERAGLARLAAVLAPRVVDAAWQVAAQAAAVHPEARAAWAERAQAVASSGLDHPVLAMEAAVARIAIAWAAASSYATDALLAGPLLHDVDLLVVIEGLQPDPVTRAVAARAGPRAVTWSLDDSESEVAPGEIVLHHAADPADEAEIAAACVLRHLEARRAPVALAAIDRVLTRRVRAMLVARGVVLRDETGWKLSTTRAAARVMALLSACAWDAGSDAVIDWLKNTPAAAPATVQALERRVRRAGLRSWSAVTPARLGGEPGGWSALIEQANGWRERMRQPRPLAGWLDTLRDLLQTVQLWDLLEADSAGAQLVSELGLSEDPALRPWAQWPQAQRRMGLAEFTGWVNETLEAGSFLPDRGGQEEVVVLPFSQLLGRRFAALVVPGCDEVRLDAAPEPPGDWTTAQREALGLPQREQLARAVRGGWRHAMRMPRVDLLVRRCDDSGEPLLPSPLVQELALAGFLQEGDDPRAARALVAAAVTAPAPDAAGLPLAQLSASAYEDLRRCPYRFHALRQLGLHEADEIDADLDKRDFGNWLHEVLLRFHLALQAHPGEADPAGRLRLIDEAADQASRSLLLPEGEFLPFAAAWPQVRDGYLQALATFEADHGARFDSAESEHEIQLGPVRLVGRIDRIDRLPDGRRMVMDYKTESDTVTAARVKNPSEDTQLAFYAALLEDDTLRAAYVNVGERGITRVIEQEQVHEARDALVEGILHDLSRIAGGAPLPALGEGQVCEWCAARGLCRKDFWVA
ncbi:PD-(D/E)XK nuclease family protein [Ramlibacter sp. AN1015]|uniref:PD-(D/E)XK nuclease family protein n=1 Tax=Ramlibacter sp. AN1015 TaxID=3133428 RepID=UPI0030C3E793